ncbi:hypothetical protein AAF712_016391 [Marasmius tenuissimus]|uniref:Uncharacterized protein n=1 Tax=Marasmius tenuissimus TaxID=585030 RepID=A0ABR2Z6V3_9AGAR
MNMLQEFLKNANASTSTQSSRSQDGSVSSSTDGTLVAGGGPPSATTTEPDVGLVPKHLQEHSTPARSLGRHGGFDKVDHNGIVSPSPVLPISFMNLHKRGRSPEEDTPRTDKRIKYHTEKVCESLANLTPEDCKEVVKFSKLQDRERDITLFAELKSIKTSVSQRQESEQELQRQLNVSKLSEHGFKNAIAGRVLSCLLSPDITAYVGDKTTEAVMSLISNEPALFNLPAGFLETPTCYEGLRSLVIDSLSAQRSNIKTRIAASMGETPKNTKKARQGTSPRVPVHELCKTLVSNTSGMEIRGDHWSRVAFLASPAFIQRQCLFNFNAELKKQGKSSAASTQTGTGAGGSSQSSTKTYKATEYWNYVDDQLKAFRKEAARTGGSTIEGQCRELIKLFQIVLASDMKTYRPNEEFKGPTIDESPIALSWQRVFARAMIFS